MSPLVNVPEGQPTVMPHQSLEGYIMMRQCFHSPKDFFALTPSIDNDNREYLLQVIAGGIDRQAEAIAAPLGLAVTAGIRVLKVEGEQSLVTSAEFRGKLQGYLRTEYQTAEKNTSTDYGYIPSFPFESRELLGSLINGPYGKRAVERVRQMLLAE